MSAGICVVMGQLLALGEFAPLSITISGFFSIFFISGSILVFNDYFDVETDKINAPHRPIPSNIISPAEALSVAIFLLFGGLILSYWISLTALLFSIASTIIGFLYNRVFKKSGLPGNLMVSVSVGMTFIYGGATVGFPLNKIVLLFGLIAALVDLGEEIAADAMDIRGDQIIDSRSLAIKYGKKKALRISYIIFSFVILLTLVPFFLQWLPGIYVVPFLIMDMAVAYSSFKLLKSKNDEGRKFIKWIYLWATFGLVIFLIMRLIGI